MFIHLNLTKPNFFCLNIFFEILGLFGSYFFPFYTGKLLLEIISSIMDKRIYVNNYDNF